MNRILIPMLLMSTLFAITSCASQSAQTPMAVHSQWIAALQANDRTTLRDLAAEQQFKDIFVDDAARHMQDYLQHGYQTISTQGGTFQGVDTLNLTDEGSNKIGWSRWRFAGVNICYAATLTSTSAGWRVLNWGQRLECPGK